MESLSIILLSAFYASISYFGLLFRRIKVWCFWLFFIYYLFILLFIEPSLGQWGTVFIVLGACVLVYWANRTTLDVILALTGYFIGVFANHVLTVTLVFGGVSLPVVQEKYSIPFLAAAIFLTLLLEYLVNRFFIRPRLWVLQECPSRLLKLFLLELLVGGFLLTVNMVYGERYGYPYQVLVFNGLLISSLLILSVFIFLALYTLLLQNQELLLWQKEQVITREYMKQMERLYEEMRTFRHDYRNILLTMEGYIVQRDMEGLQVFFNDRILPASEQLPGRNMVLGQLGRIQSVPVKSLLCNKLTVCQNQKIPFTLEIPDTVEEIPMDVMKLCTILGILLDNAVSAAKESVRPSLELAITADREWVRFGIRNSTRPLAAPVSELYRRGYTSKEGHSGLGLDTVRRILTPLDNVQFAIETEGDSFFARLDIWREEQVS